MKQKKNKYVNKKVYIAFFFLLLFIILYKLWKVDNYELATSLVSTSEPNNVKLMLRVAT